MANRLFYTLVSRRSRLSYLLFASWDVIALYLDNLKASTGTAQNNMPDFPKPTRDRYESSTRLPSYTSPEHTVSESSQSTTPPVAVNSSILSVPLSNIDLNHISEMDSSASDLDSTPMVPWNMRAGTRNAGGNTSVTQSYKLATSTPHLTHVEWRSLRSEPHRQRHLTRKKGKRLHKSGKAALLMSRDFFLLIALCIGLACALVMLVRPFIASILA